MSQKKRRYTNVTCLIPLETAAEVLAIGAIGERPVSWVTRRFFREFWGEFLRAHPELKSMAETGQADQLALIQAKHEAKDK